MQADVVGFLEQLDQSGRRGARLPDGLWREQRIEGEQVHPEGVRPLAEGTADAAVADEAQSLVEKFGAFSLPLAPFAAAQRGVGGGDAPGQSQHQGQGVLGDGDRRRQWGMNDDHPQAGRRLEVDVVEADAGPSDDVQPRLPGRQDIGRDARAAAHDQRVDARDGLQARFEDVGLLAKPRQGVIGHAVSDQDAPGVSQGWTFASSTGDKKQSADQAPKRRSAAGASRILHRSLKSLGRAIQGMVDPTRSTRRPYP